MNFVLLTFKCFLIGFIVAAPVGSVAILCINRALHQNFMAAFMTGLGAATGDTLFAAIVIFSINSFNAFITHYQTLFRLTGGVIIIIAAYRTFYYQPGMKQHKRQPRHLGFGFGSLAMSLTNPITLAAFIAIFAAIGLGENQALSTTETSILIAAIFLGALFWWTLLSAGLSLFRQRLTHRRLTMVNRVSSLALLIFGLLAIASVFG